MSERKNWANSSLGERLKWAMGHRWGGNELAAAAGIKGGSVSKMLKVTKRIAHNALTLHKLAEALDVSATWLAFGEGQPFEHTAKTACERAAELCRECGVSEEAIEATLREVVNPPDLPVLLYIDRMRIYDAEIRARRGSGKPS